VNLVSSAFEKRLRQLHRAELEKSPDLRRKFRASRKKDASTVSRWGRRLLLPLFWILIPASLILKQNHAELAIGVISFWAAGAAFRGGQQWFQQFYGSEELVIFNTLPLSDAQIFSIQKRKYLRSLGWLFWELLIAYLVLGMFDSPFRPPIYALPIAALLQSLLIMAMGIHLAGFFPMLPLGLISGVLRMAAIVLFLAGVNGADFVDPVVNFSKWFFPTGWLNYVLVELTLRKDIVAGLMLIPLVALIFSVRYSWQRLHRFYSLEGFEVVPSSAAAAPEEEELTDASFGRRGPTELEDNILAGSFLAGVNWQESGWFEKIVSRLLTPRERVLTEFLVAQKPGWTRHLQMTLLVWVIACLVVWTFGAFGGTIIFFSGYILATASLPLFGGEWRGLRQTPSGGVFLPGFSVFPIGFSEISKILLKVNLLRVVAASPLLLSFAAGAAYRLGFSALSGVVICLQVLLVIVLLQPVFILLPISKSTNGSSRMRWIWIALFIPMLLLLLGFIAGVFFASSTWTKSICYVLILLISCFFFALYRWSYRTGKFDLLSERMGDQQ